MNVIKNDNKDFLEKIYLKTALRFASKIIKNKSLSNSNKHLENSLEAYLGSFAIGPKTEKAVEESIKDLHQRYGADNVDIDKDQYINKIKNLSSGQSTLTNKDISVLMRYMDKIENYGFDATDKAITWYAHEVGDKYSMSRFINNFFDDNKNATLDQVNKELAKASEDLKYEFSKIKKNTFSKYKSECIKNYDPNDPLNTASNASVFFKQCSGDMTDYILDANLYDLLNDLSVKINPDPYQIKEKKLSHNEERDLQDKINNSSSELDKVVSYYSSPLYKGDCQNISVVDKKSHKIHLYDRNGVKQLSFTTVLGKNGQGFNKDAITKWQDGKKWVTQSTGAGVYRFKEDKQDHFADYYKKTYANQLYSISMDNGVESDMAVHSVPMGPGVISKGNYEARMNAFKSGNGGNLSGGCINLESYTYQIMKNHIKPECPLVVLPEDSNNYFMVKNGKLNFTTKKYGKKVGNEKVNRNGKSYTAEYNFTPRNILANDPNGKVKSISMGLYKSDEAQAVKKYVISNISSIIDKEKSWIEKDGLEDAISLAIGAAKHTGKSPATLVNDFIQMQEWCERNSNKQEVGYNYNLLSRKEKLTKIIRAYNQEIAGKNNTVKVDEFKVPQSIVENLEFNY